MSFSSDTKSTLAQETIDKNCCLAACLAGMLHFSPVTDENVLVFKTESKEVSSAFLSMLSKIADISAETKRVGSAYKTELSGENFEKIRHLTVKADGGETITRFFHCRKCDNMFFRGAFLASGFVNPPDKPGRIELSTADADVACDSATALTRHFRLPKLSVRRSNQILYYRDTESIEYFLSYIGANKAAFAIINAQMLKEKTNEVNRKKNCDIANITKSVTASGIYIDAIQKLMETGDFDKLPPELKQTAKLRAEYDTLTLSELSELENPPISKSQVSKRLKKIYDLYKSLYPEE
ncbi:MAG: DNA-binding protein WhiA [Clostridia bacterium]|nr:DNA-binding protein WhiA [Clostridia bacterium]